MLNTIKYLYKILSVHREQTRNILVEVKGSSSL